MTDLAVRGSNPAHCILLTQEAKTEMTLWIWSKVVYGAEVVALTWSFHFIMSLSVERYLSVKYPFHHRRNTMKTSKDTLMIYKDALPHLIYACIICIAVNFLGMVYPGLEKDYFYVLLSI